MELCFSFSKLALPTGDQAVTDVPAPSRGADLGLDAWAIHSPFRLSLHETRPIADFRLCLLDAYQPCNVSVMAEERDPSQKKTGTSIGHYLLTST